MAGLYAQFHHHKWINHNILAKATSEYGKVAGESAHLVLGHVYVELDQYPDSP